MSELDRAIETAAEALLLTDDSFTSEELARIAVEAAAPHLSFTWKQATDRQKGLEAQVERLRDEVVRQETVAARQMGVGLARERALADELAEALRKIRRDNEPFMYAATDGALARYEEARRES